VLAPTVIYQGARFDAVASFGPSLPAEQATTTTTIFVNRNIYELISRNSNKMHF
jgi:hypothetical protein